MSKAKVSKVEKEVIDPIRLNAPILYDILLEFNKEPTNLLSLFWDTYVIRSRFGLEVESSRDYGLSGALRQCIGSMPNNEFIGLFKSGYKKKDLEAVVGKITVGKLPDKSLVHIRKALATLCEYEPWVMQWPIEYARKGGVPFRTLLKAQMLGYYDMRNATTVC